MAYPKYIKFLLVGQLFPFLYQCCSEMTAFSTSSFVSPLKNLFSSLISISFPLMCRFLINPSSAKVQSSNPSNQQVPQVQQTIQQRQKIKTHSIASISSRPMSLDTRTRTVQQYGCPSTKRALCAVCTLSPWPTWL